jgi:prepilin peptidase CpaA
LSSWSIVFDLLTGAGVLLLLWAALHDIAARTVPNAIPLALLAIGCLVRLLDDTLLPSLVIAASAFLILFLFWVMRAIGGGDVKLWSAAILLIPARWQPELSCQLRILVAGGLLALAYLLLRVFVRSPKTSRSGHRLMRILRAETWRISRKAPLPYACAIASGTILTLLTASFAAVR